MCAMARKNFQRVPPYNCEMPGKEHESWRHLLRLVQPFRNRSESGYTGSCSGLRRLVANSPGGGFRYTFGAAESPAPNWMGCSGIRYTFLMVEPIQRVLTAAYTACVARRPNCTVPGTCYWIPPTCTPTAYLRASYAKPWAIDPKPPHLPSGGFWETPRISEWNIRTLLDRDALLSPLGALNNDDLEHAKQRLSTFALAAALTGNVSMLVRTALGWTGSFPKLQFGMHQVTKPVVHHMVASCPPDIRALVRAHNPLDAALYEWLLETPIVQEDMPK